MLLCYEEFQTLVNNWYASENKTERLGQHLLNNTPYPIKDPEIFYNENHAAAAAWYHDRYVVASADFVKEWTATKNEEGIPKVHMSEIKELISKVEFSTSGEEGTCYLTTCTLTTYFGFKVSGKSGTIHHERFSEAVGKRYSFENAFTNLVEKHSYLQRFLMHFGENYESAKHLFLQNTDA